MMLMMLLFLIILMNLKFLKKIFKKITIQIIFSIMIINLLFKCMLINDWWNLFFYFGLDFFNFSLILLTLWIMMLVITSLKLKLKKFTYCINLILILTFILIMSFMSIDMFLFYLFFEISLIPTFMIISIWGMGVERISSGFYLLFYTMFFSFPMLFVLFSITKEKNTSSMYLIEYLNIELSFLFFSILMSTFLVKLPMFLFHSWLLKAHVEAPYFGSMILAALLLKLGSYGLLRFILLFFINSSSLNNICISISMIGMLMVSLICLRQIDMKMIVAYSSIVHMSMMVCGLFSMSSIGMMGSYIMMISHGLCSSGLFFLVNIVYEKSNSRLMFINKGIMVIMPSMSLMWFLLCSSNMSSPLSMNLISELMLMSSLMFYSFKLMFMLMMVCFFSFLYSLYLFSFIFHGKNKNFKNKTCYLIDFYIILMHWIPLNLMFMDMIICIY